MKRWFLRTGIALVFALGCGDSGGGGGGDVSNDPGREVDGCFDCDDTEYCLILDTNGEQKNHCAASDCALDCECMIEDGKGRLEACAQYSCQDDGGILYCYDE